MLLGTDGPGSTTPPVPGSELPTGRLPVGTETGTSPVKGHVFPGALVGVP